MKTKQYYTDAYVQKMDKLIDKLKDLPGHDGTQATEEFEATCTVDEIVGYYLFYYADDALKVWKINTDGIELNEKDKEVTRILEQLSWFNVAQTKMIQSAEALHTGSNIWFFMAKVNEGYLFVNDIEWMILVDENPFDNLDDSCYEDWQTAHQIRELSIEEQNEYFDVIMDYLKNTKYDDEARGSFTDAEIDYYKEAFKVTK